MAQVINMSICLSDIPAEAIYTSEKTGKKYLSVNIGESRNEDKYGNTHYAQVSVKKGDKYEKTYIGNGKVKDFGNAATEKQVKETLAPLGGVKVETKDSGLPF